MPDFSWIVPLFRPDKYRLDNLELQKKWIKKQQKIEVELLVVEQKYKIHPTFNKQWLCNWGVRRAASDNIIIADADVYAPNENYLKELLKWSKDKKWGFGWTRLLYETQIPGKYERDDYPYPGIQEGGIVYFSKKLWHEMGGANEWIKELRGPDNDIAMRAYFISREYFSFEQTIYHRWHPHSPMKQTFRKHNKGILKYTQKHPYRIIEILKSKHWGGEKPYSTNQSFYEMRMEKGI